MHCRLVCNFLTDKVANSLIINIVAKNTHTHQNKLNDYFASIKIIVNILTITDIV